MAATTLLYDYTTLVSTMGTLLSEIYTSCTNCNKRHDISKTLHTVQRVEGFYILLVPIFY